MKTAKKAGLVLVAAGFVAGTTAGSAFADSHAKGAAVGSPGALSGNVLEIPLHIPIQLCGNTIDIIGLLNPAFGNACIAD